MNPATLRARGPRHAAGTRRWRPSPWATVILAICAALAGPAPPATAATVGPSSFGPLSGQAIAGWGSNVSGELGTGQTSSDRALLPVLASLPHGTRVTAVAAGCSHALALTSTGGVLAWGTNRFGELGSGTAGGVSATPAPVKLPDGVRISAISAGCTFSLAVSTDGQVYAWGSDNIGQLGNGTINFDASPLPALVHLPPGVTVRTISAGFEHALAVTTDGQVLAWGDNNAGKLGNGGNARVGTTPAPVQLPAGTRVTAVTAGTENSLAVTSTGQVLGWGSEASGSLGNGRTDGSTAVPVRTLLPAGTRVRSVFAGCKHTLAVTTDGQVLAWGDNQNDGELGIGTTRVRNSPFPVRARIQGGIQVVAVGGGCFHSLALTSQGQVLAWGGRTLLGNGSSNGSAVPVRVRLPVGSFAIGIGGGASNTFSLAVLIRLLVR
jgi:alpha-tubulin suppressor-like RCC1 family protein